jgi:hypothetical protein
VESWVFSPEAAAQQKEREYRHEFIPLQATHSEQRFAQMARDGVKISAAAAGLDQKPALQWHPVLTYPLSQFAENVEGAAKIELIIDRASLARFPRVLEASLPEFGWAAATFANSLRFAPLTRNGQPTELRVIFPVKFAPPKKPEAAAAAGGASS